MQTRLAPFIRDTADGHEAEAILRACVHCGFCTATCPTYQLLGDELDGPRGRIYQIKDVLEGAGVTPTLRGHLDRCLTCLSCETTCPSGVRYGRLLDIGRHLVERRLSRPLPDRLRRWALMAVLPRPRWFAPLLAAARLLAPLLPIGLRRRVPTRRIAGLWPAVRHARRVLVMDGCVQPALHPGINAACARVLDRVGISAIRAVGDGCCGALHHHLSAREAAMHQARRNIDAWWPHVEQGVEAIVVTASACGLQVKDYARLLAAEPAYAAKAERISALARDPVEVLGTEDLGALGAVPVSAPSVALHTPCTLRNGQRLEGRVEGLLQRLGYSVRPDPEIQLCCGSAGTYSILQPSLSRRLLTNKLRALDAGAEVVATANIGCLVHLQGGSERPVVHWLELLDRLIRRSATAASGRRGSGDIGLSSITAHPVGQPGGGAAQFPVEVAISGQHARHQGPVAG